MLATLEIETVVCFALFRADLIFFIYFFFTPANKNGLVLLSPNGLKAVAKFQCFSLQAIKSLLKTQSALWN